MKTVHADLQTIYNFEYLNSKEPYHPVEVNLHQDFEVKPHDQIMLLDTTLEVGVAGRVVRLLDSGNAVMVVRMDDFFVLDPDDIAAKKIPGREDSIVTPLPAAADDEDVKQVVEQGKSKIDVPMLIATLVVVASFVAAAIITFLS